MHMFLPKRFFNPIVLLSLIVVIGGCLSQNTSLPPVTALVMATNIAQPTNTLAPTLTILPSPTTTPAPTFNGVWNIRVISDDVVYEGSGKFKVEGQSISGTFSLYPELIYSSTGTLDASAQTATGTWELQGGGSGIFAWQINPEDMEQLVGNLDKGKFPFCGARPGVAFPSPCEWP